MNRRDFQRKTANAIVSALCCMCALLVILPLALILFHLVRFGASAVDWNFFTHLPKPVGESGGGMANAIVGSLALVALAVLLGVPVGVLGGIYLSEFGSPRVNAAVRFCADILNGTPSIVWGILVYAMVVVPMKGASAYAGGLALGLILMPLVLRTTEGMLALVPDSYREAALALGIPKWKYVVHIVLKSASKGIITGILLACARIAGETAPLLFTASGNQFWSRSLSEPIASLPRQIYTYAISPYDDWHRQAWAGALVLLLIALAFNAGVRALTRGSNSPAAK
ncbi:MAG TPA: phosphate ABC transporter permease PstA [Verrucomicrobiae bacterium]|jgi:phosphate transport system permease protein